MNKKKIRFRNIFSPNLFEIPWKRLVNISLFFLVFFLCGCHSDTSPFVKNFTHQEQKDLECFLNLLFFEEAGAFVALGSKPMCSASILDTETFSYLQEVEWNEMNEDERGGFQKNTETLSKQGVLSEICYEYNPYKGYLAWQKLSPKLDRHKFLVIAQPQGESFFYPVGSSVVEEPICAYDLIFASVPKTAAILAEHYSLFKEVTEMDFDPFSIVFELENPHSVFWRRVFQLKEHIAKGLLFGFGKKNAALFDAQARHFGEKASLSQMISDFDLPRSVKNHKKRIGIQNSKNFAIPFFISIDPSVKDRYQKEKLEIEHYYKKGDVVDKSLELLLRLD